MVLESDGALEVGGALAAEVAANRGAAYSALHVTLGQTVLLHREAEQTCAFVRVSRHGWQGWCYAAPGVKRQNSQKPPRCGSIAANEDVQRSSEVGP